MLCGLLNTSNFIFGMKKDIPTITQVTFEFMREDEEDKGDIELITCTSRTMDKTIIPLKDRQKSTSVVNKKYAKNNNKSGILQISHDYSMIVRLNNSPTSEEQYRLPLNEQAKNFFDKNDQNFLYISLHTINNKNIETLFHIDIIQKEASIYTLDSAPNRKNNTF